MEGEIRCSPAELLYLASLLGVETLLGAPNPYEGRLATDVDELLAGAAAGLMQRGLLFRHAGGDLEVEERAAELLVTCGRPDRSLVVTYAAAGGEPVLRYFHIAGGRVAELGLIPSGECLLRPVPADSLMPAILKSLGVGEQTEPCPEGGTLREEGLTQARGLTAQGMAAEAVGALEAAGLSGPVATAMGETLAHPVGSGAIAAIVPGANDWAVEGLGLLTGRNGLWILRPVEGFGGDVTEVAPAGSGAVEDAVRALVGLQMGVGSL